MFSLGKDQIQLYENASNAAEASNRPSGSHVLQRLKSTQQLQLQQQVDHNPPPFLETIAQEEDFVEQLLIPQEPQIDASTILEDDTIHRSDGFEEFVITHKRSRSFSFSTEDEKSAGLPVTKKTKRARNLHDWIKLENDMLKVYCKRNSSSTFSFSYENPFLVQCVMNKLGLAVNVMQQSLIPPQSSVETDNSVDDEGDWVYFWQLLPSTEELDHLSDYPSSQQFLMSVHTDLLCVSHGLERFLRNKHQHETEEKERHSASLVFPEASRYKLTCASFVCLLTRLSSLFHIVFEVMEIKM